MITNEFDTDCGKYTIKSHGNGWGYEVFTVGDTKCSATSQATTYGFKTMTLTNCKPLPTTLRTPQSSLSTLRTCTTEPCPKNLTILLFCGII